MAWSGTPENQHSRWGQSNASHLYFWLNFEVCNLEKLNNVENMYVTWKKVIWGFEICSLDSIYIQQNTSILEKTTGKRCVFVIRQRSIALSRIWWTRNTITVWHAIYFSFYNKASLRILQPLTVQSSILKQFIIIWWHI